MQERPNCPRCGEPMMLLVVEHTHGCESSHYECVACEEATVHQRAKRSERDKKGHTPPRSYERHP